VFLEVFGVVLSEVMALSVEPAISRGLLEDIGENDEQGKKVRN
jgi:hypothetical protein